MTSSSAPDPILDTYTRRCLATAYVPAPSELADASDQLALQVRHAVDAVADATDDKVAARLAEGLEGHDPHAGHTLVAVVGEDDVEVWDTLAEVGAQVHPGPLPALADLLVARQAWLPHVVVRLDRVGADIEVVSGHHDRTESVVEGSDLHITKSNPGGWSQRRFQQRAEDQWEDNARLVAERLQRIVAELDTALVLLAGDEEMISRLREDLPSSVAELVEVLSTGGRAEDGSEEHLEAAVDAAVRQAAADRVDAAVRAVTDALGQGTGVAGRTDVLDALFQGRVDTLVIDLGAADGKDAHVGPEPGQVAADSSVLHELGVDAERVPLVDAALRGAAATGARVVLLDDTPRGEPTLDSPDEADGEQTDVVALDAEDGLAATLRG